MKMLEYPFTQEQLNAAADAWGCNCGPSALAFALQTDLETAHKAIPEFDTRRYTSPSMMAAALRNLRVSVQPFTPQPPDAVDRMLCMFHDQPALVRIQWTGPWTKPGANPKWAYRQTHWIATWFAKFCNEDVRCVFDCNGGIMGADRWRHEIVPLITSMYPRADGDWFPTHIWRVGRMP